MTQSQETMWHKQHKVIHNEVGQNGAWDRSQRVKLFLLTIAFFLLVTFLKYRLTLWQKWVIL